MVAGLTAQQAKALTSINILASGLSLAGSGFIVLCYLLFKELRKFSFQLVFYLCLSDLLCSCFNLFWDPSKEFLCYVQGYTTQYFTVASFLWTTTISFTLHRTVVKHKTDVEELVPMFHLYVWGTSLILAIIPSIGNDYEQAGSWCWLHSETRSRKLVHFLTFYIPLWGAVIYNGTIYFQVIQMLNYAAKMAVEMSDLQQQIEGVNRWALYPLILIGCWMFGTINQILDFVAPGKPLLWLYFLDVGTAALMGLFNAVAYGLNASMQRILKEKARNCWPERFLWWRCNYVRLEHNIQTELAQFR